MSDGKVVVGTGPTSFVKKKHELSKLQKAVHNPSLEAVQLLADIMRDEKQPIKLRAETAKLLVEIDIKVNAEISKDSLTRQIAELKVKGAGLLVPREPGELPRQPPKLDFMNVQVIE